MIGKKVISMFNYQKGTVIAEREDAFLVKWEKGVSWISNLEVNCI
jgi:hypothetical protein